MSAFIWSFVRIMNNPLGSENDLGILRFPTVCIIGFIPHMLILIGITICATIYGLALVTTALSLPPDAPRNPSLKERFSIAFRNLQANVQFSSSSSMKLNWQEDFYTTLLKVGFNVLAAASEAVYLNEGSRIRISEMTWLEEKRIQELSSSAGTRSLQTVPSELLGERIAKGVEFTDHDTLDSKSGYAKERRSKTAKDSETSQSGYMDSGLGLAERRTRWQMVLEYFKGITLLLTRINARLTIDFIHKLGIERVPSWLTRYAAYGKPTESATPSRSERSKLRDFWVISDNGSLTLPRDRNVDVEVETRSRLRAFNSTISEEAVDVNLYGWWKTGGWWGDVDTSGDYQDTTQDDDITSVVSMSTNASQPGSDEDNGRRTPTQEDPFPVSREDSVEPTFGLSDLARLLDPKTAEDREEAQILARHLQSEQPMTRSQYRRRLNRDRARILPVQRTGSSTTVTTGTAAELLEEDALEQFILERRNMAKEKAAKSGSWDTGAAGMGSGGPQCVVCQSSPRVVLVWPCGCLSICDDCRVGVAARNFSNCLCCRTNVVAYSRLYVP